MANKKGKLSKVEIFYIENNYKILDIAQLAEDLDRTIQSIEKYIKENLVVKKTTSITAGDQMTRRDGIVVMTENASTLSDSKRSKPKVNKACITRIKDDV